MLQLIHVNLMLFILGLMPNGLDNNPDVYPPVNTPATNQAEPGSDRTVDNGGGTPCTDFPKCDPQE